MAKLKALDAQKDYLKDLLTYMLRNKLISTSQYGRLNATYLALRFGSKSDKLRLVNSLELRGLTVIGMNYYLDFKRGMSRLVILAEDLTPNLTMISGGRDDSDGMKIIKYNMRKYDERKKRLQNERTKNFDKYKK